MQSNGGVHIAVAMAKVLSWMGLMQTNGDVHMGTDNVAVAATQCERCTIYKSCLPIYHSLLIVCNSIFSDDFVLTNSLLDKVMSPNQWHIGVQERHLMFKSLMQLNYNVLVFTHFYGNVSLHNDSNYPPI